MLEFFPKGKLLLTAKNMIIKTYAKSQCKKGEINKGLQEPNLSERQQTYT